jgi:crotonobetainyl-CoA:carnitine CoA-transferase CaiB-like acyl-CoA transferase
MTAAERSGPLAGIRVLDIGRFVAGPVAATVLADFGADVIKIEHPRRGDDLRKLGWLKDGESLWWSVEGRNKRSVTLDLGHPAGRDLLLRLVSTADVLVENFRPGTLERWNLGWEALHEANPRLVLLRTSGYGQTGPYSPKPAFNTAVESLGGLRYLVGEPDRPPARPGIALGDYVGALTGAIGVLLALYERDGAGSGTGQWIDNALYEAVLRITEYTIPAVGHLGRVRQRIGGGSVGTVPARSFLCADGVWVGISAANDDMFVRLCDAIGRPELAEDPRSRTNAVRIENSAWVHEQIETWCASRNSEEVVEHLDRVGVSVSEVFAADRLIADEQVRHRESVVTVPDPVLGETTMQGVVPRLSRTPGAVRHAGQSKGAETARVLAGELGLDDREMAELSTDGVI